MKYCRFILIIGVLLMTILFSCSSNKNDDDDDSGDDDSADDDNADDDDYLPEIDESWSYDIIDNRAYDYSLSLDSDNNVYIVYYNPVRDDGWDKLFYAFSVDGWQVKQFPFEGSFSEGITSSNLPSAIGSNGELHLLYIAENDSKSAYNLFYTVFDGNMWKRTLISDTIYGNPGPSLTIDDIGNAHISYYDGPQNNRDLMYVNNCNDTWQYEIVEPGAGKETIYHRSVLKIRNDIIYLAFIGLGSSLEENKLIVAKQSESEWEKAVIADDVEALSMDVDANGFAHIISHDSSGSYNGTIIYMTDIKGEWTTQIAADDYISPSLFIAIDLGQKAHILHSGLNNWKSKEGTMYVNNTSGEWLSEEIMPDYPEIISMAIDGDNKIHVAMNAGSYLVHLTREIPQE